MGETLRMTGPTSSLSDPDDLQSQGEPVESLMSLRRQMLGLEAF